MFWIRNHRSCIMVEIDEAKENREIYTYKYLLCVNKANNKYYFHRVDKEEYDYTHLSAGINAKDLNIDNDVTEIEVFYTDDAREFLDNMPVGTYELNYNPLEHDYENISVISVNDFISKANLLKDMSIFIQGNYKGFLRVGFAIKRVCTLIEE